MAGEIFAEDNSPMMMTVGQYNERVAYTWKLATEAEQERIIKLLEENAEALSQIETGHGKGSELMSIRIKTIESTIALIKGE